MGIAERVLSSVHVCLLALIVAGLLWRRLFRLCYSFAAYAATVLVVEALILVWPHRFFVWSVFIAKEIVYGALKLALLLEITALTYQSFPSARAAVRRLLLCVMLAILAMLLIGVPAGLDFPDLVREKTRRLANGTALGFFATWALVLWYRLPLHRLHRAILRGLAPYLLIFAGARSLTLAFGWNVRQAVNLADGTSYAVVLAYWAWEIWRRPPEEPDFLRTLQPWRARL